MLTGSVQIQARLEMDDETEEKVRNFTKALKELPYELSLNISVDGSSETSLKLSLADLLIEQVKEHFSKN